MTTPSFLHNGDNFIVINSGTAQVKMTLEEFNYFEPSYSLESPYVWQYYLQGVRWTKNTRTNETRFAIPWADGDTYITKVPYYIDNLPIPPQTLEEAKSLRTNQLIVLWGEKNSGNINYTGMETIFPSTFHNPNALITYQNRGNVPIGFTKPDVNGNLIVMTLAQLMALNDGVVDLFYLNELNFNNHAETISTLTTIADVMNYDITTGWPTLPYVI